MPSQTQPSDTPAPENEEVQASAATPLPSDYEDRMLEAFVQKPEKFGWYKRAFASLKADGADKIPWVWSWWAFFGGFWFLLYRKAYMAALGLFIVDVASSYIPGAGLVVWVLTGGFAVYFVYLAYKKRKEQIEAKIADPEERIEAMRRVGGYHTWVVWVAVILNLFVLGLTILGVAGSMR